MKLTTGLLAVLLLLAGCTGGQPSTGQAQADNTRAGTVQTSDWPRLEATRDPSGFRAAGLDALAATMRSYVSDGHVIGIQTLLVKDGAVAHYQAHGSRQADPEAALVDDTIFRIYSMTKPLTGVALMQQYEAGKFELDDPVEDYIPEFADLMVLEGEQSDGTPVLVEPEHAPTMRELMSHTAGFAYGLGGEDYANGQFRQQQVLTSADMDTMIDKVASIPLLNQPGTEWYYSVAVDVQGYLVEKFSGMDFDAYLETSVFDPLGMSDTDFYVPEDKRDRLADLMVYSREQEGFVANALEPDFYGFAMREETMGFPSGGGGLASTISDYARFCQMMLNGGTLGGQRILDAETVDLMTRNQLPDGVGIGYDGTRPQAGSAEPHQFGLDFGLITDPEAMESPAGEGTYYWGGAAGTWFWIDPENDLFFIGMIQRFGELPGEPANFRAESMRLVYEALEE